MEHIINCKNCGAPLHYDKTNYGRTAICNYCNSEYHLDLLGRLEEYKIKINIMGQVKEFYIGNWEVKSIFRDSGRDINGNLISNPITSKMILKLIEI